MSLSRCALSRSLFLPVILLSTAFTTSALAASDRSTPGTAKLGVSQSEIPLVFEENAGQLPAGTLFAGRAMAYSVQLKPSSLSFAMAGKHSTRKIDIDFSGAKSGQPVGMAEAAFKTNYYLGNDPRNWHTGVRNFDRVALRGLYPGIDAEFYSHNSLIEHDFLLAPQADASQLSMRLSGARAVRLTQNGDLMLDAEDGYLRLHKPEAYQVMADGSHKSIDASFHLVERGQGAAELGFTLGSYDHARQLVIDPVITYATYMAGAAGSVPSAIVSDATGNVYLTGYTASTGASWGAASTVGTGNPGAGTSTAFAAKLDSSANGSQIAWLSYFGSASASVLSNALALNPAATSLYIGGQTTATDLPVTAATVGATVTANGSTYGYVASFATATGALGVSTYVEATSSTVGTTTVNALFADAVSVTLAGSTTGKDLPTSADALPVTTGVVQNTSELKGYIFKLNSAFTTKSYATYVAGDNNSTLASTVLTGVAADSTGNIYVTGTTRGDFPQAGLYSTAVMNIPVVGKTGANAFAAQIIPSTKTLGYSYWTDGEANDILSGLALDTAGNLYVTGSTASATLMSSAAITTTYTASAVPPVLTPLNTTAPASGTTVGFFSKIDALGELVVTSYLSSSTANSTTTTTGVAVDGSGSIYFSGATNGLKASFPTQTSGTAVVAPLLPVAPGSAVPQDLTPDSTTVTPVRRGFVLQLAPTITTVTGLAYLGPSAGTSSAVGVALDGGAAPNVYGLVQDVPSAGGADFVTASAAQPAPQVTDGTTTSAYVAKIGFAASAPGSIAAGTLSYAPGTTVYAPPVFPTAVSFTWNIVGAGSSDGGSMVVFNLPYSQYLKPYTLSMLTVTLNGGAIPAGQCTIGNSPLASAKPGITCVLPNLHSSDTAKFVLADNITAAVNTAALALSTSVPIPAAAFDAQGDSLDLTQNMGVGLAPAITFSNSVSASTVNAATGTADVTTPNTQIVYTYSISNTGSTDSPAINLTTNLGNINAGLYQTASSSSTGCDPTLAAGCVVAKNSTLTYTVTGIYIGSQFGASTPGPYPMNTTPSISYTAIAVPITTNGTQNTVSVKGNASLSAAITTSANTYSGGGFQLGDTNVQIVTTLTNSGPNEVAAVTVTPTLPQGFVADSYSSTSGACTASPCKFTSVPGNGGSASLTATGHFTDTGTTSDAVAPPVTSASPNSSTVAASQASNTVAASLTPANISTTDTGSVVTLPSATTTTNLIVSRVNALSLALATTATTVNEANTGHVSDAAAYTATLTNGGPSIARGVYLSFPIPVSATGTAATISNLTSSASAPTNAANQLVCSSSVSLITCYEADLTAVSSGPATTPKSLAYTISFNATFPETTIPLTVSSGKTSATQSGGSFYAAAAGYTSGNSSAPNPTTITIQRSTKLMETLSLVPSIHAPASYADTADLNLDEHVAGNAPGVNDSLTFTSVTYNAGVNDAAAVSVSVPVPPYLLILSALPSTCTINGVAAPTYPYNTGATGVTLTCAPASSTTPAGTAAGQLTASGTACTANSAACVYVSFPAKFADAPTAATIVGNLAKATVASLSATVTGNNVDAGSSTPSGTFGVQRAAHLLETFTVAPQVHAPATFSDTTDINLDEHIANNAAGVNDQVLFTSSTSNTGVNYALATSVVLPLPAYLEIFSLPAGCTITGATATVPTATGPYLTGASGASLTCIPPASTAVTPNTPTGVLQYAGTCAAATTAQCLYATFPAKFVDAASSATIVGNNSKAGVTPVAATVTGTFSNSNTGNTPNTPAAFSVQRAAHLRLATASPIATTYTDNSALTLDGANPMIGQAAVGANALTRAVTGSKVYNCIRYTVTVVNEGPNYTNSPTLNYTITQAPFTTALKTVGTATSQGPVNCSVSGSFGGTTAAAAPQTLTIGSVGYGNGTQTLELDGYFDLNSLGGANSAISAFQTSAFTTLDYQDSDTTGTTAKDYLAAKSVEVVNTPITNATAGGFRLIPAGANPAVTLIFTSVTAPGITASGVSTAVLTASSSGGVLPAGKSPYPPDASAVKKLYQTGKNPLTYMVPTTAIVPTGGTNPTSVCVALAGGLPDLFIKPERTLLWALQNVPAGTTYNAMPSALTITPTASAPATGDITVAVTPNGATPYVSVPSTIAFPQPPQAQPSQLCGQVNGFTTSTALPATFAVLEPVNFAPYVVAATTSVSAQQGKGSTSAQTDIYLQVSNTQTHDFNDSDPCYIGGTRSTCNDNPYLYAFVFGGGNTGTATTPILVSSLPTELNCNSGTVCPNGKSLLQTNLSAGAQAYVAVADQVTGVDAFDDKVVSSGNYTANPFVKQGNFLTSNAAGGYSVCDPGVASGYYAITTQPCTGGVSAPTAAVPSELYIAAGSGYTVGNVGASQVTGSSTSGTGLIPLPYPALPSTPFSQVPVNPTVSATSTTLAPAIAYITPGQTAGFVWNWLNGSVQQSGATKYNYTLACTPVTSLTSVTPVTLPTGMTCAISTSDPNASTPQTFASNAANYAPTIYVTTTGNLFSRLNSPAGRQIGGLVSLAMLLPLFALRRRFRRGMVLAMMIVSLATVPMLTGCGSSGGLTSTAMNVTPAGTYYFQVTATATSSTTSPAAVYSAVFEVVVQPAN